MKKAILLFITLHITQTCAHTGQPHATDPVMRVTTLALENLSIEKEEAWIKLLSEVAKRGIKDMRGWESDIAQALSRPQSKSHEILLLRLSAICSAIASNLDPHLMLGIMPKPLPHVGRYLFGCGALGGLCYYLYHATPQASSTKDTKPAV